MYKCYYNFSILTTLPFPPVITLTADTIAAVVWFVMPAAGVDVAVCLCGVNLFFNNNLFGRIFVYQYDQALPKIDNDQSG